MCWALSPLSRGIWAFKIMPIASVAVGKDLQQNPCSEKAVGLKSTLKRCKSNTTPVENRIFSSENATIRTVLVLADVVVVYLFHQALLYQARTTHLLNSTPTLHFPLKSNFRGVLWKKRGSDCRLEFICSLCTCSTHIQQSATLETLYLGHNAFLTRPLEQLCS